MRYPRLNRGAGVTQGNHYRARARGNQISTRRLVIRRLSVNTSDETVARLQF